MNREVVITGIGMIVPAGESNQEVWHMLWSKGSAIGKIRRFDSSSLQCQIAGEVKDFQPEKYMNKRLARKLDRFSQYSLAASKLAIEDAELDLSKVNRERFGAFVGNCFGGWEFTDRELRNLHVNGVREVSPFQATAWFPAAPQGQITINLDLHGYSKTVVCDRASGLASIGGAYEAIKAGHCDMVLAGGAEALVTPFIFTALGTENILAKVQSDDTAEDAYRPFDKNRSGLVPGEGAVFLVLEEKAHALERGAHIYSEILGFALTNDACFPDPIPMQQDGLSRAMELAIDEAGIDESQVNFLFADAMGSRDGDWQETEAVHKVFSKPHKVKVTSPKPSVGHLYGAAGALDVALASLSIARQSLPPTRNSVSRDDGCELNIVEQGCYDKSLNYGLVNSRGTGGINASLLLGRCN